MTARRATKPAKAPDPLAGMRGAVQAARRQLGLDDETYQAILVRLADGKTSSKDLDRAELARVLDELRAKGFKPKVVWNHTPNPHPRPDHYGRRAADHPSAKKARALWLSLYELGVIRDAGEPALEAFAARQLGCARMQWMDQGLNYKLIEALKAMAERNGWSQDLAGVKKPLQILNLKLRLVVAQLGKLQTAGLLTDADRETPPVSEIPEVAELEAAADEQIRRLGRKIRQHDLVERLN
ncbi:gp16 family protein [Caulobacter soli]|uniref:gp16 family protein n=1 Tax=Caulobacter soli TaxID=2708539 RepID=UPI0013EDD3C6|nr:regulatory protein GemA [Caulobacter soli]